MHIFLIRHGETEHNVAGLLAGVTDSRLTNHGVLQTRKLGANLIKDRSLRFTIVYSSDLQRASMTANEICKAQNALKHALPRIEVIKLEVLRERDFGSLELVSWSSRRDEDVLKIRKAAANDQKFKPKETRESMQARATSFIVDYIEPLLALEHEQSTCIAIVSHGILLAHLWRALLSKFPARSVTVSPEIASTISGKSLEHMSWSNTGCLELDVQLPSKEGSKSDKKSLLNSEERQDASLFTTATMNIKAIDDKRHLMNLKRARGGIGSAAHDERQQSLNTFFKKRKTEPAKPAKPA